MADASLWVRPRIRNTEESEKDMYTVGVDLGGTNIAVGICDENLNIVIKGSVPTFADRDSELIVKDMADLVSSLAEKAGISFSEIDYVGIAAPGSVNSDTGVVEYSNNIKMSDFPMWPHNSYAPRDRGGRKARLSPR